MTTLILTLVAAVILVVGIVSNQDKVPLENLPELNEQQEVLSEHSEDVGQSEIDGVEDANDQLSDEGDESISIEITNQPSSINNNSGQTTELDDFKYSNAEVISSSNNSMSLRSGDSPDDITNWYKERIRSLNMNVNSFVTTKTNDRVNNELVGAGDGVEIRVVISKEPDQQTNIEVKKE